MEKQVGWELGWSQMPFPSAASATPWEPGLPGEPCLHCVCWTQGLALQEATRLSRPWGSAGEPPMQVLKWALPIFIYPGSKFVHVFLALMMSSHDTPHQSLSECGPGTSSKSSSIWELVRNANSLAPPQSYWSINSTVGVQKSVYSQASTSALQECLTNSHSYQLWSAHIFYSLRTCKKIFQIKSWATGID